MMETLQITQKVVEYYQDYSSWLEGQGRSANTIQAYMQDLSRFIAYYELVNEQGFTPTLINSIDLRGWRAHSLEIEKVSPATWNRRRVSIGVFCQWAEEEGIINYDPSAELQGARQQQLPPRWLKNSDFSRFMRMVEQLVNAAKTQPAHRMALRDQAMVMLMTYAGLRVEELCALELGDVLLSERKGKVTVRHGKGDKKREIPLNSEVRRALKQWLLVHPGGEPAIFVGKHGERMTARGVQRRISDIGTMAGLQDISPHCLRHTFAKRQVDAGVPLTVVSQLLGHSRLETTARYCQPGWEDFEKAVERI